MNDELVLDNLGLIYYVMNKLELYNNRDEYYDAGLEGLIKAAKDYDPGKGVKFSSLATVYIRNQILNEIRLNNMDKRKANYNTVSLDKGVKHDSDLTIGDLVADKFNMEKHMIKKEEMEAVFKAIDTLDDNEKKLLKYYIFDEMTYAEIAKKLGMNAGWIYEKIKRILRKLKVRVKY